MKLLIGTLITAISLMTLPIGCNKIDVSKKQEVSENRPSSNQSTAPEKLIFSSDGKTYKVISETDELRMQNTVLRAKVKVLNAALKKWKERALKVESLQANCSIFLGEDRSKAVLKATKKSIYKDKVAVNADTIESGDTWRYDYGIHRGETITIPFEVFCPASEVNKTIRFTRVISFYE